MTSSCGVNSFQSDWSINAEFSSTCMITTIGNSLDGVDILHLSRFHFASIMMTSSNGNIFRVTGHLCGKGQWRGALMFTLICARINGWVNNREAGDLRRYRTHYDVIVMNWVLSLELSRYIWELVGHFWWRHLVNRNYTKSLIAKLTWKMAFQYN